MRNTIVLINTLPRLDYWNVVKEPTLGIPMGLLSIATILDKNGYKAKIIDPIVDRNYLEIIKDNLNDCLYVGISVMTAGVASGLEITKFIKKLKPSIPIIWGGIHPTLLPEQTLANENIDFICWGEGEYTALDLADAFKRGHPIEQIEGLGLKINGKPIVNKRVHFNNPDILPLLNYDLLDMRKYLYRDAGSLTGFKNKAKVFVLNTGVGCPYRCTFCINTHQSQKFRQKSLERLTEELDRIVNKFDPDIIHIQDDLFFVDKHRVLGFLDNYERKNYHFKWFTLTRANYFRNDYISDELAKRIKTSCLWLGLGIESGSDDVRKRLRKEINVEQINRAVDILSRNKIPTGYAFMIGLPYETKEEMIETAKLILRIKRQHPESSFSYQLFRPYPSTELFYDAVKLGYKMPQCLEEWAKLQDIETGYTDIKEADWVTQKRLVGYLQDSVLCSLVSFKDVINYPVAKRLPILLAKLLFGLSLKMRILSGCWKLLVEDSIYRNLKRLLR